MELGFTVAVHAAKEKIWEYYSDIQKWYLWEKDLKSISLDKGFKTGSKGVMELDGMPPVHYALSFVKENYGFCDKTETPFGNLYFNHEIIEAADKKVSVKHSVRLETDTMNAEKLSFLRQVFSNVPEAVLLLKRQAEL
ncbi:polyketide cyclase [Treponema pedis]|uniref:polyketide cyclase n=1 Tax=Treponema pedis TaxID=409322 RepID=UPI0003FA3192|nr:polyketide cyclase [Treponema pedis]